MEVASVTPRLEPRALQRRNISAAFELAVVPDLQSLLGDGESHPSGTRGVVRVLDELMDERPGTL
jgi:hypothetical protein